LKIKFHKKVDSELISKAKTIFAQFKERLNWLFVFGNVNLECSSAKNISLTHEIYSYPLCKIGL